MIVCEPTSGLTSRMYVLADAYDLAEKYDQELVVIWRKTSDCDCRYNQVFADSQFSNVRCRIIECNQFEYRFSDLRFQLNWRDFVKALREIHVRLFYLFKHSLVYVYFRSRCRIYKNFYKDGNILFYESNADKCSCFFEAYSCITNKGHINNIKFCYEFEDEAHSIMDTVHTDCIGVHIRRTDHGLAKEASPTEKFIVRMNEEIDKNPSVHFFVATDDWNEQKRIVELYGDRIVVQPNKKLDRSSKEGMHSSIIDVLCLSMTKYVLGSNSSVFSKFAADYGNIKLYIV